MAPLCSPVVISGALRLLRRVAVVAGVFLVSGAFGCAHDDRFALGNDDPGLRQFPAERPADRAPDVHIPPSPVVQLPPAPPRVPAGWNPRVAGRKWQWIVIHHSATPSGGAAEFDKLHRETNGWDELGYHFVIGNGTDTKDGLVEVGPRWVKQKHGAHAKTPDNRFNDYGVGICLVGNFETGRPSQQQLQSLATLVAFLMKEYDIPANRVIGHDDTGRSTACPGHNLEIQLAGIRRAAAAAVASGNVPAGDGRQALYATHQP